WSRSGARRPCPTRADVRAGSRPCPAASSPGASARTTGAERPGSGWSPTRSSSGR
ncbi:MAG: hypothetical protein AVDCRST_MAG19-2934, partial [uncultured Thermomicrobiales bacterium]